jgi:O-antigen/teichoic acid export membrane protein
MVSSATSVALFALGALSGPILARALGPAGRGDIAAVLAPATVLALILSFGLPGAAAYFVDSVPEPRLLLTATAFGVVVGAPVCAVLWVLAPAFLSGHSAATVPWGRAFLVALPLSAGLLAALEVRRRQHPGLSWNCWRSAPLVVPTVLIVFLALTSRLTVGSALAAYLVGLLSPAILLASRLRGGDERPRPSLRTFRMVFPYAWRTATTVVAASLTYRLDQVILVTIVPPADLGLYAVAVTVALLTNPLASGLSGALFGHLRGERSPERAAARFRQSLRLTFALSAGVAGLLAVGAPLVLLTVFGAEFEPAATALRLLLPGAVAFDVQGVITTKLLSEGRPGEASRGALVGAVITVAGMATIAPRLGINGAAMVTSAAWVSQVLYLIARGALRTHPGQPAPPVVADVVPPLPA